VAEIRIEQTQRNFMPWFIGLALVALLVIGLTLVFADPRTDTTGGEGAREVGNAPEQTPEKKKDATPRRLQQWADHVAAPSDTLLIRAA
jgi:hypothetical protein